MRDDVNKLGLPKRAVKYARRTAAGGALERQPQEYIDVQAEVTNQPKKGFQNRDLGDNAQHAFKEAAERVVKTMLETGEKAARALVKQLHRPTKLEVKWFNGYGQDGTWETIDVPWYIVQQYRKLGFQERGTLLISWIRKEHGKEIDELGDLDALWPQGQDPMKVNTALKELKPQDDAEDQE